MRSSEACMGGVSRKNIKDIYVCVSFCVRTESCVVGVECVNCVCA